MTNPPESTALDPLSISSSTLYKLIIGAVIPRPIALVSTQSSQGQGNLAPFSFFNGVSSNPPCLSISITRKSDLEKKDTLRNIEETGQLVINTVGHWMIEPAHQSSAEFPYGVDELIQVGLTPLHSIKVKPSRVMESPVQFECEFYKQVEIGDRGEGSATLVIAKIVMVHVHTAAYVGGKLKVQELKPVSRLGGASYGLVSGIFDLERPKTPV